MYFTMFYCCQIQLCIKTTSQCGVLPCRNYVSPIAQMENEGIEFMNIDARNRGRNQYLDQVMGDLNVSGGAGGDDDLLDLMDKA